MLVGEKKSLWRLSAPGAATIERSQSYPSRLFAEFCGAHAFGLLEVAIDLLVIGEIQLHCDLVKGEVGFDEQFFCPL